MTTTRTQSPELIAAKCATRAVCAEGRLAVSRQIASVNRPSLVHLIWGAAEDATLDTQFINLMLDEIPNGPHHDAAMQSYYHAVDAAQRCADLLTEAGR